ncbi:MAG: hypothetical protein LBT16_11810 [Treponema sp.]|jgi:hypothetical protein|nr:hypothetical protein [Treponema sp.]
MKKFLYKCAILCLLIIVSLIIIILLPVPHNDYLQAINDKHERLRDIPPPRIVLAGGSNIAFGIDSETIQNTLHIPVVNIGIQAGIGLGRILDDIAPLLSQGDMLVIIPEYTHFENGWNGYSSAYELIFETHRYSLAAHIPFYGKPAGFSAYLQTKLLKMIPRPPNPLAKSGDGFNEYGDYVKHLEIENQPFPPLPPLEKINLQNPMRFFRFTALFAERGIKVLISYPSYEETAFHNSAQFIAELDKALRAEKTIQVISTPEDYCFPTDYFYDSVYHLNAKGREIRTARLIRDLREYLEQQGGSNRVDAYP